MEGRKKLKGEIENDLLLPSPGGGGIGEAKEGERGKNLSRGPFLPAGGGGEGGRLLPGCNQQVKKNVFSA